MAAVTQLYNSDMQECVRGGFKKLCRFTTQDEIRSDQVISALQYLIRSHKERKLKLTIQNILN